jgi:hypothetical protein
LELLGILILIINIFLLLAVLKKLVQYREMKEEYRRIELHIAEMVQENSRIVDMLLQGVEDRGGAIPPPPVMTAPVPIMPAPVFQEAGEEIQFREKKTIPRKKASAQALSDIEPIPVNTKDTDISVLHQQGLSVLEIAAKLGVSQDEIRLKLRLMEELHNAR